MNTPRFPRRWAIAFIALASLPQALAQSGWINADPTAITLQPGGLGTTTVSWSTANCASAQVWVSVNGQTPTLFGDATSLAGAVAPWIQTGANYQFLLYGDRSRSNLFDAVNVAGTYSPLTINEDGSVRLHNLPFRGRSVNYYSAFERALINGGDTSYVAGFRTLGAWGLSYARVDLTGYWPARVNLFFTNRPEYFRRLDAMVAAAESYNVGLVLSFFWTHFTFSDLAGERLEQLGAANSVTRQKMREFTTEIVNRYKTRPVVWAWEFGNEWNLAVDLPNATSWLPPIEPTLGTPSTRDPVRDVLTTSLMVPVMEEFAGLVHSLDPGRPISTGHASPRATQWHQDQWQRGLLPVEQAWGQDTYAQNREITLRHTPPGYDLLSIHVYPGDEARVASFAQMAGEAGLALFSGEFGSPTNSDSAFTPILASVAPASLANIWVFDRPADIYNTTTTNARTWMLTKTLGLEAWLRLDATNGTSASDTVSSKHGTLTNGPVWTNGKVAGALEFDGVNDAVLGPVRPYSGVSSNFTITLWANPKASTTLPPQSTAGTAGTSGQRYAVMPEYGAGYGTNRVGAGISVGTNGVGVFEHSASYLAPLLVHPATLTNWTHVAVVYTSNRPSLYLNGSLVRTGLQSTKIVHPSSSLGGMSYGWYRGGLDDVRVFNRSLTPGEVRSLNDYGKNWIP